MLAALGNGRSGKPRSPLMHGPLGGDLVIALLAIVGQQRAAPTCRLTRAYPVHRIAYMLTDARPAAIITSTAHAMALPQDGLAQVAWMTLSSPPSWPPQRWRRPGRCEDAGPAPLLPGHTAYVIYTSGSTGTPERGWWSLTRRIATGWYRDTNYIELASTIGSSASWRRCHLTRLPSTIWGALLNGAALGGR